MANRTIAAALLVLVCASWLPARADDAPSLLDRYYAADPRRGLTVDPSLEDEWRSDLRFFRRVQAVSYVLGPIIGALGLNVLVPVVRVRHAQPCTWACESNGEKWEERLYLGLSAGMIVTGGVLVALGAIATHDSRKLVRNLRGRSASLSWAPSAAPAGGGLTGRLTW